MAGVRAFREAYMSAELPEGGEFSGYDARQTRYYVLWSLYENTAYTDVHTWSQSLRAAHALYQYTRNLYNPTFRLGEFWSTHLMGGVLDPNAGDGSQATTALPIVIPEANQSSEELRKALALTWRWSNWQSKRELLALWGSILGDVALQVVDDVPRKKVYLRVVHPGIIKDLTLDPFGHVKGYVFEEKRMDGAREVVYREEAERDKERVLYRTFKDNVLFSWDGNGEAAWDEAYGFIPLVFLQHIDVGLDYGWSEVHAQLSKIREVDELASMLGDQIRKTVNAIPFFTGTPPNKDGATFTRSKATTARPQIGREELDALYSSNPAADVKWMVAPIDYEGVLKHVAGLLNDLEQDYPELRYDRLRATGQVSGESLKVAREPAEAKVIRRRARYDDALVRAQQMAVAIGGMRGLEGFSGFNLESYANGLLDHSIGNRPVFAVNPQDELAEAKLFWETAQLAIKSGLPLISFLKTQGWDETKIAELQASDEYQARVAMVKSGLQLQGGGG